MNGFLEFVGGLFLGMIGLFISAIVRGFVLVKMWTWFVVPYFNLPKISIPLAIGLSLLIGFLVVQTQPASEKSPSEAFVRTIIVSILFSLISLFLAWIVSMFL